MRNKLGKIIDIPQKQPSNSNAHFWNHLYIALDDSKARQTRFVLYQPLFKFACEGGRSLFIIHYQQMFYRTGKLRRFNQHAIACEAIMTVRWQVFEDAYLDATLLPTRTAIRSKGIKTWPPSQVKLPSLHIAKSLPFPICTLKNIEVVRAWEWDYGVHTPTARA